MICLPQDTTVWPESLAEGHIQIGWRYKFRDRVTADCVTPLFIGACTNLKPSCELCAYWNSGAILKIGPVNVRMSLDDSTMDVIGRCKITDGSKQALIMTWVVLAKYFYVIETLLSNYKGICPEVSVANNCSKRKQSLGSFWNSDMYQTSFMDRSQS